MDYIAPCLLFVSSLACGNSVVVELQKGWQEKPLMYLAIVGGRGTNKTSCFDFALAPIRARDNEEYDNYVEVKNAYDLECSKPAKERKTMLEPPVFHQYILSDFTPELKIPTCFIDKHTLKYMFMSHYATELCKCPQFSSFLDLSSSFIQMTMLLFMYT